MLQKELRISLWNYSNLQKKKNRVLPFFFCLFQPLTPLMAMLSSSLTKLYLSDIPTLVELPLSFHNLNKLKSLSIIYCINLETLPNGISLKSLDILDLILLVAHGWGVFLISWPTSQSFFWEEHGSIEDGNLSIQFNTLINYFVYLIHWFLKLRRF